MKKIKNGWVIYKGFRIDWSPRCGAWKIVHPDTLPHGGISYMLMDFSSLKAAKECVTRDLLPQIFDSFDKVLARK